MGEVFDIDKWREEYPMDYLRAIDLIGQASNKVEVFEWIYGITRLHIPDSLYKYHALDGDEQRNAQKLATLKDRRVFMSDAKGLNDPFDSTAYYYRPEQLARFERLKKCNGRIIDDFAAYAKLSSFTAVGVNSMPMWAHYSNNHHGYCVEYDMRDKRNVRLSACMFPVQYVKERIDVTPVMDVYVDGLIREAEEQMAEGKKRILVNDPTIVFLIALFTNIKHESWSYEKEFRCTVGRNIEGMPYFPAYPKAIYVGHCCNEKHALQLVHIASQLHIPAYRMTIDERSVAFGLVPVRLG